MASDTTSLGSSRTTRPPSRVTMTDVARRAGVSQTTVSLVLNEADGARVSVETRLRVQRAAERLGYRMQRDRSPPRSDLKVIGALVDQISTDPWTAIALDGARERAAEHGIALLIAVTGGVPGAEDAMIDQWRRLSLTGVIYATINTRRVSVPSQLAGIPTVLLNCYAADRAMPSVVPGEVAGGHTAAERLIRAGHKRIGFIGGEPWMDAAQDRLKGYRRALASWDLPFDAALVRHGDWQASAGYSHTHALLRLERPPTAIFCCNDLMALGCFEALKETGRRIPTDVAVIGYDDREIAQHLHPPLTTVLLPHFDMGALAAEMLLDGPWPPARDVAPIKLECPLVERSSV